MSVIVCAHEDFRADVDVNRLVSENEPTAFVGLTVDVRVRCIACNESLRFRVPRMGLLSNDATRSLDCTELRAPAWIGDDDTLGADLPGFTVRVLRDDEQLDDSGRNYETPEP